MSAVTLFGFHAVTVRLKTAPKSVNEVHVDTTRRDQRMRQLVERVKEAGIRVVDSDDQRLSQLRRHAAPPGRRRARAGARAEPFARRHCSMRSTARRCCWCSTA